MLGPILIVIGIALAVMVFAAVSMSLDVSIGDGWRKATDQERTARRWRPPFGSESDLYDWARSKATRIVGRAMAKGPTVETPSEVVAELHKGATRAMLPTARDHERARTVACPEDGQGIINISAVEAIGLASYLRQNLPAEEVDRIHDLSVRNARQLAAHGAFRSMESPCSLQGDGCMCLAYSARPLRCRPLHAAILADRLGVETLSDEGGPSSWAAHADAVRQGLDDGLTSALADAGLDAKLYELHGALATALQGHDVAARWLDGEDVFGESLAPVAIESR